MTWLLGPLSFLALVNIALVIWAVVDAIRVQDDSMYQSGNKLVWVLVIVLLGAIGAIVYFVVGRPRPGGPSTGGPVPGPPPAPLLPPPPPGP